MTNEIDLNDCHIEMRMGRSGSGWYLYLYLPWELQAINPWIKSWKRKPSDKAICKAAWGFLNAALILEGAGAMQYFFRTFDGKARDVDIYNGEVILSICGEDIC